MVLLWVYRKFVGNRLNLPPFCDDKDKRNESFCDPKFDETNNLQPSYFSNQQQRSLAFQKKRVFYFSPNYFSREESSTEDSMYKFYLKSLNENYSSYKSDSKYHYIVKTDEDKRSASSFQDGQCNMPDPPPPAKYATNRTNLEKQLKNEAANQHCPSPFISQVLDYYLIFPLYVAKMMFSCHNTGYYYMKYQGTSDLNLKSPETDIYSVDDLTFENVCLQEKEESIKEPSCNLLLESTECEAIDMHNNGNYDQKYDIVSPEIYKPYNTLETEATDGMSTSDLCEASCVVKEPGEYVLEQSYNHVQADGADDLYITDNTGKFESPFGLEKYDFSLGKLFRKLVAIKPKD